MGSNISCVSCIERDHEEGCVKPLLESGGCVRDKQSEQKNVPSDLSPFIYVTSASNDEAVTCTEPDAPTTSHKAREGEINVASNVHAGRPQQPSVTRECDSELQAQINAIVNARVGRREQFPLPRGTDNVLQAQINAIVNVHLDPCRRSQASSESYYDDHQAQMNAVVNSHYSYSPTTWTSTGEEQWIDSTVNAQAEYCVDLQPEHYQQSPIAAASNSELQDQINAIVGAHASSLRQQRHELDPSEFASPSPAKSLSPEEFGYYANLALEQAKERNTPAKSPAPTYTLLTGYWTACEDDFAPRQLSFTDVGPCHSDFTNGNDSLAVQQAEPQPPLPCIDLSKDESSNCQKVEARPFNVTEIPSPTRKASRAKRQELLWANMCDEEVLCQSTVDKAQQKTVEEEAKQKTAEEAACRGEDEEAARLREQDAKWLREIEEKAELEAMDKLCVEAFLESVRKCAWRERVRTPIKGTNLYTKHMRPCRPAGTSVDVKDSTFRNLGNFLQFLEFEGLLCLKPGLSDPVVSEIHFNSCHRYKYDPTRRPLASNAAWQ